MSTHTSQVRVGFIYNYMIIKQCLQCGNNFKVKPYRRKIAKFCSHLCASKNRKGSKHSTATKEKMSKSAKASINTGNFQKGIIPWNKGKKYPEFSGKNHPNWKGGKSISNKYMTILSPNHPFANKRGYIYEQRLVAEKCLGRYLTKKERVHHINENKLDNRPENLYLFSCIGKHKAFHGSKNRPILVSNIS